MMVPTSAFLSQLSLLSSGILFHAIYGTLSPGCPIRYLQLKTVKLSSVCVLPYARVSSLLLSVKFNKWYHPSSCPQNLSIILDCVHSFKRFLTHEITSPSPCHHTIEALILVLSYENSIAIAPSPLLRSVQFPHSRDLILKHKPDHLIPQYL